ncbi:amidohydrolase family protein [Colwellia sp. MEBiC06753]
MKIVDPHIHLFDLAEGNYHWLKPENPPFWLDKSVINRSFSTDDLVLSAPLSLAGFVYIEAGFDNQQPWREIAWLEAAWSKTKSNLPFRSVATIDLTLPPAEFNAMLHQLTAFSSVVGVRHILDDDAMQILSSEHCFTNLTALAKHQLLFELQLPFSALKAVELFGEYLNNIESLTCIINHAGLPNSLSHVNHDWRQGLSLLANYPNVAIKCSGWEMIDRQYQLTDVQLIINHIIEAFSIERVMLASNFPLTLFTRSYNELWLGYVEKLTLSNAQQSALLFNNAKHWYQLDL